MKDNQDRLRCSDLADYMVLAHCILGNNIGTATLGLGSDFGLGMSQSFQGTTLSMYNIVYHPKVYACLAVSKRLRGTPLNREHDMTVSSLLLNRFFSPTPEMKARDHAVQIHC